MKQFGQRRQGGGFRGGSGGGGGFRGSSGGGSRKQGQARGDGGFGERRGGQRGFSGQKNSGGSSFGGGGPGGERFERRRRFLQQARERVREAFTGKGASLAQAVRAIDDVDSAVSLLFQRLKELFAINFPEFSLENEESFARVLSQLGRREDFDEAELAKLVGEQKAKQVMEKIGSSFGSGFSAEEAKAVQELAKAVHELQKNRKELEKFVSGEGHNVMKNVCHLIEPVVAARLLSAAGSLQKLAEMPSSTVQVIGAEKSLFKHLRSGTPPPKHGIIFNCQIVRTAPKDTRGRIARVLAGKIAIAAKADAFTGNFIAPKLKQDLEKALKK